MQEQVRLDKINQDLSLEIGVPGKDFVNDMNPEDRMRHGIILRQLRKRRNVTIKGTRAIADTKTNIRLNAKEISEQIEVDKKTTCK